MAENRNDACSSRVMRSIGLMVLGLCACTSNVESASSALEGASRAPQRDRVVVRDVIPGQIETFVKQDLPAVAIAVDDDNVYWTAAHPSMVQNPAPVPIVFQCPKSGCEQPIVVGTGSQTATAIAVDSGNVYWATSEPAISFAPIGGAAATLLSGTTAFAHFEVRQGHAYWSTGATTNALMTCDLASCAPTHASVVASQAFRVTRDGAEIYWVDGHDRLVTCPVTDCSSPRFIAQAGKYVFALWVEGSDVIWSDEDGLKRVAKGSRTHAFELLVPSVRGGGARDIVADETYVYWTDGSWVQKCVRDACNPTRVDAPYWNDGLRPNALAMDEHYVYWTTGNTLSTTSKLGSVMRVSRW